VVVAIAPGAPDRKVDSRPWVQIVLVTLPIVIVFQRRGLAVSEKQIPQLVANIEKGH
jgi:hypothetical protein